MCLLGSKMKARTRTNIHMHNEAAITVPSSTCLRVTADTCGHTRAGLAAAEPRCQTLACTSLAAVLSGRPSP